MGYQITRPDADQLKFTSSKTGDWVLEDYLQDAELGNKPLATLLGQAFNPTTGEPEGSTNGYHTGDTLGSVFHELVGYRFKMDAFADAITSRQGHQLSTYSPGPFSAHLHPSLRLVGQSSGGSPVYGGDITAVIGSFHFNYEGTLASIVAGNASFTSIDGPLSGNVTGNVSGDVTGNITGNVAGNVTATTGTSSFKNVTVSGSLDMNAGTSATVTGLAEPIDTSDAATKQYVDTKVANLISTAPALLDTLAELAAAIGDPTSIAVSLVTDIATKLPKAGGTMSGNIDMGAHRITNLPEPTVDSEASTRGYTQAYSESYTQSYTASIAGTLEDNQASAELSQAWAINLVPVAVDVAMNPLYGARYYSVAAAASAASFTIPMAEMASSLINTQALIVQNYAFA